MEPRSLILSWTPIVSPRDVKLKKFRRGTERKTISPSILKASMLFNAVRVNLVIVLLQVFGHTPTVLEVNGSARRSARRIALLARPVISQDGQ